MWFYIVYMECRLFDERTQIFELLVQGIRVLCISKVAHVPQCNEHTTIFLY